MTRRKRRGHGRSSKYGERLPQGVCGLRMLLLAVRCFTASQFQNSALTLRGEDNCGKVESHAGKQAMPWKSLDACLQWFTLVHNGSSCCIFLIELSSS